MKPYYEHAGITIYHGDCLDVLPALNARPELVITDPPYIVSKIGRHGGDSEIEGTNDPFWILPAFQHVYRLMAKDAFLVSFYGWRNPDFFLCAWRGCGFKVVSHLVWIKNVWGLGAFTRAQHESAFLLTKGQPKPAAIVSDVFGWKRERDLFHPAQKPVTSLLPVMAALGATAVLDPFMGSGSSLVAAKNLGIAAIGIEIEERYCETAARRLSQESLCFGPQPYQVHREQICLVAQEAC